MIVLDTNVLWEILRPIPEPRVLAWISSKARKSLFTTVGVASDVILDSVTDNLDLGGSIARSVRPYPRYGDQAASLAHRHY